MNELVTIAQYAERINAAWRQSVQGVIEAGRLLAQAKAELSADFYKQMIEQHLPFVRRTADRLIAISQDERIATHASLMPPSWTTMYELTRLDDEAFTARIDDGTINAEMERKDVAQAVKQQVRTTRELLLGENQTALPNKRYGVIVADPEWRFEPWSRTTGMDRAADNHYPTSCLEVIASRDVDSIAAGDSALGLWSTVPMLREALAVMEAWGFEYKTHWAWAKDRIGTGYWNRNAHEIFLLGTRGKIPAPAMGTQWKSIIEAPAARHSAKPEIFLQMMEQYFPTLPKIELNRRGAPRSGWDAWGNETTQSAAMPSAPGAACVDESPLPPAHAGSSYFAESEV